MPKQPKSTVDREQLGYATGIQPTRSDVFLEFSRSKLMGQYWPGLRTYVESLTDAQILASIEA